MRNKLSLSFVAAVCMRHKLGEQVNGDADGNGGNDLWKLVAGMSHVYDVKPTLKDTGG